MVAQHWAMVCVTGPVLRQRWKKHNVLVMGKMKIIRYCRPEFIAGS